NKYLVTSALPYANGPIHLGHLAGAYLPADIFVRYCRLKKRDVVYICGSDEHGVPIMLRARAENTSPQKIVDRYHQRNKKSFADFGISFDYYGRTSSKVHHETSQEFFRVLAKKNVFSLKKEKQLYDPVAKMFLADRFVKGTCPACGYAEAYGDQCEKCGKSLSPLDLIDPKSAITDAKPSLKETTHWYLPLSDLQKPLEDWIDSQKNWKSNVLGQVKSWLTEGLKDRAVTRDLPWGVDIPEDIAREANVEASGKVLYVWFDAPIGYISASREWAQQKGDPGLWKEYWQKDDCKLIHFIGKDNIVFHCIIFPAMLKAHGDYVIPENVPANEFLNLEGQKLSTSRNYAVWLEEFLEKFDADSLRYCLTQNMPETKDSDFSWKDYQARHNNELADILGNFINRTFTFAHKYFTGKVPQPGNYDTLDQQLVDHLKSAPKKTGAYIDKFQFRPALKEIMDVARFANKYFNDQEPWLTNKSNPEKCATTINLCLQIVRSLAILIHPVLPFTSQAVWDLLNLHGNIEDQTWEDAAEIKLEGGHQINKPEILFKKIEDHVIEEEIKRLKKIQNNVQDIAQEKDTITYDDFQKIDLRIAEIINAEKVKKTDKLVKLTIEVGNEERTIVAGIAEHYLPENLIGKKIVVVYNLEPSKIRGITSQGMLLAARDENDNLTLLTTDFDIISDSKVS
ncbi:methionine--tRNA ligase, partial [Calditrichota bacterium]